MPRFDLLAEDRPPLDDPAIDLDTARVAVLGDHGEPLPPGVMIYDNGTIALADGARRGLAIAGLSPTRLRALAARILDVADLVEIDRRRAARFVSQTLERVAGHA